MAYGDFKDLSRRKVYDILSCDKTLNIAKNPKCNVDQRGHTSIVYVFW